MPHSRTGLKALMQVRYRVARHRNLQFWLSRLTALQSSLPCFTNNAQHREVQLKDNWSSDLEEDLEEIFQQWASISKPP